MDRPVVWLINPYGPLPGERWREYRCATLGRILADAGCNVTWWTAGFSHHFKTHRCRQWKEVPVGSNFRVCLVPTPGYGRHIGLGRLVFELVFAWRLDGRARRGAGPDFIITPDTPQASAMVAARLSRRFGAKLIIDVMDLWPELFELVLPRVLRPAGRRLLWPFYALRRVVRRRADAVTALCPSYLRHVLRDARAGVQSRVIYNGIDVSGFRAQSLGRQPQAEALLGRSKPEGETWAVFAGTVGNNYDMECLAAAARILQKDVPAVRIWVAGDGPLRSRLARAVEQGLGNLHLLGQVEHSALASIYRSCDVGLCAYSGDSNVGMPDKAYDYMAAGLPIISSLRGDLQEFIRTRQIGLFYEPGDAQSLAFALRTLARDGLLRKQFGSNAFACGWEFDRAGQYGRMVELLHTLDPSGSPLAVVTA